MAIQRIDLGTAPSGTGGDTNRSAFTKINQNFTDSANAASRQVGTAAGNVMEVGAFGVGFSSNTVAMAQISADIKTVPTGFYRDDNNSYVPSSVAYGATVQVIHDGVFIPSIIFPIDGGSPHYRHYTAYSDTFKYGKFYTTQNTTVDGNGFIKAASPIVKLFADKIELNDEAAQQKITFVKNGVGDYLIKGSTGFAQEGWYIEMPKDANGNVLVAVIYEQLANNDISVKTYAKMFDPETGDIVANTAKPRDIPATRWIDIRLQPLPQPDTKPFSTDETVATNAE